LTRADSMRKVKAAVVSDDLQTVSAHFGMAHHYLVYDIEDGMVKGREVRDKVGHGQDMHHHEQDGAEESRLHNTMLSNVADCQAIIAAGMGTPMYTSIVSAGMKAYITRIRMADDAVKALAEGTLDNHLEFLH
jgi:predicted Fe-Mo cluster-binding NifX family protein